MCYWVSLVEKEKWEDNSLLQNQNVHLKTGETGRKCKERMKKVMWSLDLLLPHWTNNTVPSLPICMYNFCHVSLLSLEVSLMHLQYHWLVLNCCFFLHLLEFLRDWYSYLEIKAYWKGLFSFLQSSPTEKYF